MCGIAGYIQVRNENSVPEMAGLVKRMCNAIAHRGRDDSGTWCNGQDGVALGHRRLSILDLSPTGHQPMESMDRRYTIVFNGEIYNFRELRQRLSELGHSFRGHSDTEVMLAAFTEWGIVDALPRFEGMFAFAVWDARERVLCLARDRAGEKPLYYGWVGDVFLFGSELKALRAHPKWSGRVDRHSLGKYLEKGYIPAPGCIYVGIQKLLPGSYLILPVHGLSKNHVSNPVKYWSFLEEFALGEDRQYGSSPEQLQEDLTLVLLRSVKRQMAADVPVGAFLSGGVDSSMVVALMQQQSSSPIKTFTIGFESEEFNEAPYARAVAKHLKTDHTELYISSEEAISLIPNLPTIYDEPFFDPSQIPTHLVSRLAKSQVTVSLSGDGGDELFGGYVRYLEAQRLWTMLTRVPLASSGLIGTLFKLAPFHFILGTLLGLAKRIPIINLHNLNSNRFDKVIELLSSPLKTRLSLYKKMVRLWHEDILLLNEDHTTEDNHWDMMIDGKALRFESQMMALDAEEYLPDNILVKLDRASMAVGLESRVPFLDYEVIKFATRLPSDCRIQGKTGKWILRKALSKFVPDQLIDRPKKGFSVPIAEWLRGPLRGWATEMLEEKRLLSGGWFNAQRVNTIWQRHLAGKGNMHNQLWSVLMFQAWLAKEKSVDL